MKAKISLYILLSLFIFIPNSYASKSELPSISLWQQWTFSGTAMDEEGHPYYYYFLFQQIGKQRLADVLVLSDQLQPIIRYHKQSDKEPKRTLKANAWKIGRTFFRFNPITQSWVFGIKTKNDVGFNFKADIKPQDGDMGERQSIAKGLSIEINQFQQLNGHVFYAKDKKEQFVSAKRGWLRYIEASHPPIKLTTLLCNQPNGSGVYSLQFDSEQAKKASIVGWRNEDGVREQVSQFLTIKPKSEAQWALTIPSPQTKWHLKNISTFDNDPFHTFVMTTKNSNNSVVCFYQQENRADKSHNIRD